MWAPVRIWSFFQDSVNKNLIEKGKGSFREKLKDVYQCLLNKALIKTEEGSFFS